MSYPSDGVQLFGPALPAPFVEHELKGLLTKRKLLPKTTGKDAKALEERWQVLRRKLGMLGEHGLGVRVRNHVLEPLLPLLAYSEIEAQESVRTREGDEDGGLLLKAEKATLRSWCWPVGTDLDAPSKRGHAFRFSPARVAQRVLLAKGERFGLVTDGSELRFLLCDPARPDSQMVFRLDAGRGGWRSFKDPPESFQLFLALARPEGLAALPELIEQARLHQSRVTKELRKQAREAIEGFLQGLLDHPRNAEVLAGDPDKDALARDLWREGLAVVYRLLFILKLETAQDPARSFSFASTSAWRNTYSPSTALAPVVRAVLEGGETGGMLEGGLRALFRMFSRPEGLRSSELRVSPLGGMLFGAEETRTIDGLEWGEQAVAALLDRLLWTGGKGGRERVHYGPLDVEDLGRVYEALLELEPGIATEPMCRLRRAKLEVVVPAAQGEPYRAKVSKAGEDEDEDAEEESEEAEDDAPKRGAKATVQWIEAIPPGRFFLRVGLGRKASGSYYTPHAFVRFLVQETLGPLVVERSPIDDPQPTRLLELKVLDPAMGSGHFLVEACRFLADKLYEACRSCDERASEAEAQAEKAKPPEKRDELRARANALRERVQALPDPNDELMDYLPSRAPEGEEAGLSQRKAEALCRRMVAVHCLYGVDKNRLAVELAKLTLWLESYAEGLPLTFLDHRLVQGDSLAGPFFEQMLTLPASGDPLQGPFAQDLRGALTDRLQPILEQVRALESTVGKDVADLERKRGAKARLDAELQPFITLARVWAGGVMLGDRGCDDFAYEQLARAVADGGTVDAATDPAWARMYETGALAAPYDLWFAEVFAPRAGATERGGFNVVLGNPPWDAIQFKSKEFLAGFDLDVLSAPTKREREAIERRLLADSTVASEFETAQESFEQQKRANDRLYEFQKVTIDGDLAGRQLDQFRVFMERSAQLAGPEGFVGLVVPSAFHANAGAAGVRQVYLNRMAIKACYSFENKKQLFDIHRSFKFAVVVAQRSADGTKEFPCGFYLHDLEWLFSETRSPAPLRIQREQVERTGGAFLTLVEARDQAFMNVLDKLYSQPLSMGQWWAEKRIVPNTSELPMLGSPTFQPAGDVDPRLARGIEVAHRRKVVPLHEGKTFHQFDDLWETCPRYLVHVASLGPYRERWSRLARHYRLTYRAISRATDERTGIAAILPPGTVCSRKGASDINAGNHPAWVSLVGAAVFNSFSIDFCLRATVQTDVSLFITKRLPFPTLSPEASRFLAHQALRLCAKHEGFGDLWHDQLKERWDEETPRWTWPVLGSLEARWQTRVAMEAVVADAFSLSRAEFKLILDSFSHKEWPSSVTDSLAAFDELRADGVGVFVARHDPYHEVPLPDLNPTPKDLPFLEPASVEVGP